MKTDHAESLGLKKQTALLIHSTVSFFGCVKVTVLRIGLEGKRCRAFQVLAMLPVHGNTSEHAWMYPTAELQCITGHASFVVRFVEGNGVPLDLCPIQKLVCSNT